MYALPFDLIWVPVFVVGPFLVLPLLIRFTQRMPARPEIAELDLKALPKQTAGFLMDRTRHLIALGFEEPTTLALPAPAPNVKGYLILLVNRPTGDKAMATVLVATDGLSGLKASYVEFSTRFDSGVVFDTSNSPQLNAFPPLSGTVRTQAARVADVAELYAMHRHVMAKTAPAGEPWVFPPGGAVDYLLEYAFDKSYGKVAAIGWLHRCEGGQAYRPTFKGAYLMVWGLMPPVSWVRKWRLNRHADALLAEMRAG